MSNTGSLSVIARRFSFVRETDGQNLGLWVQWFQRFAGGKPGDSWCADFLCVVLDVAYAGNSPLPTSGACDVLLNRAKARGYLVDVPAIDDVCFLMTAQGNAHHVSIVTGLAPITTIAGNTSPDGLSDNGTGVFEHINTAAHCLYVRLPKD